MTSRNQFELIGRVIRGERLTAAEDHFEAISSWHHGHVDAVLRAMRRLGFEDLVSSTRSRERDLVVGMVAARLLAPDSKLATTRWWHTTTLPAELGVADADEDDLYDAMDWLLKRQPRIEKKLASRHLKEGGLVLFDLTSSYFEGVTCPLAALGKNRDGKSGGRFPKNLSSYPVCTFLDRLRREFYPAVQRVKNLLSIFLFLK